MDESPLAAEEKSRPLGRRENQRHYQTLLVVVLNKTKNLTCRTLNQEKKNKGLGLRLGRSVKFPGCQNRWAKRSIRRSVRGGGASSKTTRSLKGRESHDLWGERKEARLLYDILCKEKRRRLSRGRLFFIDACRDGARAA